MVMRLLLAACALLALVAGAGLLLSARSFGLPSTLLPNTRSNSLPIPAWSGNVLTPEQVQSSSANLVRASATLEVRSFTRTRKVDANEPSVQVIRLFRAIKVSANVSDIVSAYDSQLKPQGWVRRPGAGENAAHVWCSPDLQLQLLWVPSTRISENDTTYVFDISSSLETRDGFDACR